MTKKEFVDEYSENIKETKTRAGELINDFLELIEDTLVKGESVQFIGWGAFEPRKKEARKGRNPQTGEEITIAAKKVVKFKAGKVLADKIAKSK